MCSCHFIIECCVMFSGVKLSMGSFVLFSVLRAFLIVLLFRQIVEKLCIFWATLHYLSLYYELKFSIETNFDTLISNRKFYFHYNIDMTS